MPKAPPLPSWKGEDAFVIGGGSSLKQGFNWGFLKGRNTIGCNDAYELGVDLCKVCVFGDYDWWTGLPQRNRPAHGERLRHFGGYVATNYLVMNPPSWLAYFQRQENGLAAEGSGALAWNMNTGALAINLALSMGVQRVFLLGFDLGRINDVAHWHGHTIAEQTTPEHYARFDEGFHSIQTALPSVYPGRQIINVTDGGSRLFCFPRMTIRELYDAVLMEAPCLGR